jgi:hypothetical protein
VVAVHETTPVSHDTAVLISRSVPAAAWDPVNEPAMKEPPVNCWLKAWFEMGMFVAVTVRLKQSSGANRSALNVAIKPPP